MLIADLHITAKTWKQPRCPSLGKWIRKLADPDNGVLFSTKKK